MAWETPTEVEVRQLNEKPVNIAKNLKKEQGKNLNQEKEYSSRHWRILVEAKKNRHFKLKGSLSRN